MAFLWLQALDAENQIINIAVFIGQDLWVLFLCSQHGLVALNRIFDSVIREIYLVAIPKLSSNLSHRPMTSKSAMTYPGEDIPVDHPPRHGNAVLCFWTTNQSAYQMQGTTKRVHPMMATNTENP